VLPRLVHVDEAFKKEKSHRTEQGKQLELIKLKLCYFLFKKKMADRFA